VEVGFSTRALGFTAGPGNAVLLDNPGLAGPATLLRFAGAGGGEQLLYCRGVRQLRDPGAPFSRWQLEFDTPLAFAPVRADII
jgi:hypothetical protein